MENQKNNKGVIALLIVIIVILAALCILFATDTISFKSNKVDNNNESTQNIEENNSDELYVSKIDSSKEWIYDAEYEKNISVDSYETQYKTYYAKDIIVPFINVNSSYANISNNEIKNVFDDAIKKYNDGVNDKSTYVDECNYKKYINQDVLSVILTYGVGATDVVQPQYYTYNIDLKSGKQLSYQETYNLAGFNSDNIDSKVENAITNTMKQKYSNGDDFDTYNNKSINNYKTSINNNTIKFFIDENQKFNIIVTLEIPAGRGQFDAIITVE